MKKARKRLIYINIMLCISIACLLIIRNDVKEATVDNIDKKEITVSENHRKENKKETPEDNTDKKSEEQKKLDKLVLKREFISINEVRDIRFKVEKQINVDFKRSKIKIDHLEFLAYREGGETYIHALVFRVGIPKEVYAITFKCEGENYSIVRREIIYNVTKIN